MIDRVLPTNGEAFTVEEEAEILDLSRKEILDLREKGRPAYWQLQRNESMATHIRNSTYTSS